MQRRVGTRFALWCVLAAASCGGSGDAVDGAAGAASIDVNKAAQTITWSGMLMNQLSGVCADVVGGPGTADGTPLQTYPCETSGFDAWGGPSDQLWIWEIEGYGYIRNQASPDKCLDIAADSGTANGAPIVISPCFFKSPDHSGWEGAQRWYYHPDGFIIAESIGKCIDVAGAPGNSNHLSLQLWDCELSGYNPNGSVTDQRWIGISAATGTGGAPGIPPTIVTGGRPYGDGSGGGF